MGRLKSRDKSRAQEKAKNAGKWKQKIVIVTITLGGGLALTPLVLFELHHQQDIPSPLPSHHVDRPSKHSGGSKASKHTASHKKSRDSGDGSPAGKGTKSESDVVDDVNALPPPSHNKDESGSSSGKVHHKKKSQEHSGHHKKADKKHPNNSTHQEHSGHHKKADKKHSNKESGELQSNHPKKENGEEQSKHPKEEDGEELSKHDNNDADSDGNDSTDSGAGDHVKTDLANPVHVHFANTTEGWEDWSTAEREFRDVFWKAMSIGDSAINSSACKTLGYPRPRDTVNSDRRRGIRADGRCGKKHLVDGVPGVCSGTSWKPCCSKDGYCSWNIAGCCDTMKSQHYKPQARCPDYSKHVDAKLERMCGRLPLPTGKLKIEVPLALRVSRTWSRDTELLIVANFWPDDGGTRWLIQQNRFPVALCTVGSADDVCGNPLNFGEEAFVYTRFILNNWDHLPKAMAFIHGHARAWHQLRSTKTCRVPEEKYGKARFDKPGKGKMGGIDSKYSCPMMDVLTELADTPGAIHPKAYIPLNKKPAGIPHENDLCPWWDAVVKESSGGRLCPHHEPGFKSQWPSTECCGQFIAGRDRIRGQPRKMWETLWRYASNTQRWEGDKEWKLADMSNTPGAHKRNPIFEAMWGTFLGEPYPIVVTKYP